MWGVLVGYLVLANAVSFALFGIDKSRSRARRRRIPERTLLLSALVSGSLGAWLGMTTFRHKTAKRSFQAQMAVVTAVDVAAAVGLVLLTRR